MVIRKLFPMLPFNAFQVINEEASQRIEQSKKGGDNERTYTELRKGKLGHCS